MTTYSRSGSDVGEFSSREEDANGGAGETDANNNATNTTEYFANTNVLTLRLKWVNPETFITDPKKSQLLTNLNQLIHNNKGLMINPKEMENYQYFSDHERMAHLKECFDVYLFERGNVEVESWYRDPQLMADRTTWFYDVVIQAQFKPFKDLQATKEGFLAELKHCCTARKGKGGSFAPILECWSISENPHALNHPGNLYVRGIPKNLSKEDLAPIFVKFGPINVLKIISDPNTNESMGFGFVSYALGSQASCCIKELNGNLMNGSPLFVNYHVERKERERIHFDQWKQNEQVESNQFQGVFVGNLPIFTTDNTLVTPSLVLDKFKEALPDCEILSYFFPKSNSQTNVEYADADDDLKAVSPLNSNAETFVKARSNRGKNNRHGDLDDHHHDDNENINGNGNKNKNGTMDQDEINSEELQPSNRKTKLDEGCDNNRYDGNTTEARSTTPVKDSSSALDSSDDAEATNEETCSSQNEHSPLKGYGFLRFSTHEMALKCIETFNGSQWFDNQLIVNKAVQKFHQHQYSHHSNSSSSVSSMNNTGNSNSYYYHNHSQQHHNGSGYLSGQYYDHVSPHQSFYQQSNFPSLYSYKFSRRHSERSVSSRQSNVQGYSPPPLTPLQLNDVSYSRNHTPNSGSVSIQDSLNNVQYGNRARSNDSQSPSSSSHNFMQQPPLSQPAYPLPMLPPAGGMHTQGLPPPLATQSIPVLTNTSTNSTSSPRNNSVYGPLNMPLPYSTSSPMFNTPLPIPRSDEQESNLYVKHLPLDWRDEDLHRFFEKFGEIISAKIITAGGSVKDQDNRDLKKDELFGKSKGYGFVCFQNPLDASRAMYHTDGVKMNSENTLFVSFAQRRSKSIDSIETPMPSSANYNKKFLNAMYQQQQQQQYYPWVIPVPIQYPPPPN
ncbi:unnamed protein product [Kluyveromyces dobzhanskii CBS 2104]|uniref:WGS project CCBQ000000000 data, contig 00058 n=1 Tax=Kluyveromyces dobzhanskii CBS 2104 TaxID=1427455 RepID=A0A0A8LD42_9SACH|nr:unnamed protein product [Kluyveromyces dobzhanskii CBS 2104]